ncbi:hypothetical protein IWX90DRAFT_63676 [Phyllosticta citrichinensis]|uniref:Uncharacterized protein n=1 Tax=Phyllosticta citrichinensis TaxID=1130410 RepID=A0ABR1XH82_9PEZI
MTHSLTPPAQRATPAIPAGRAKVATAAPAHAVRLNELDLTCRNVCRLETVLQVLSLFALFVRGQFVTHPASILHDAKRKRGASHTVGLSIIESCPKEKGAYQPLLRAREKARARACRLSIGWLRHQRFQRRGNGDGMGVAWAKQLARQAAISPAGDVVVALPRTYQSVHLPTYTSLDSHRVASRRSTYRTHPSPLLSAAALLFLRFLACCF